MTQDSDPKQSRRILDTDKLLLSWLSWVSSGIQGKLCLANFKGVWSALRGVTLSFMQLSDPLASSEQKAEGLKCAQELQRLNSRIMLRREGHVVQEHLGCGKSTSLVFCCPSEEQTRLCQELLESRELRQLFQADAPSGSVLNYLSRLQQICNHPCLGDPTLVQNDPRAFMRQAACLFPNHQALQAFRKNQSISHHDK